MTCFALRAGLALLLSVSLAACSLPRGAGLQREVLSASAKDEIPDFAVAPVTRSLLDDYAAWPATGETGRPWINRQPQPANRIIAAGDSVSVTVWNTEDNSLLTGPGQRSVTLPELRVASGGTVFLPYIGTIRIAGMSPEHAREVIETRYAEVAPSAQVQLGLAEGRASTVSLVGGVAAPGSYPLPDNDFTVLGLIAEGGGVPASLENPQILLHRDGRIYGTSVERLFENPALDTTLRGGDRVIVEPDARIFLSLGAAGSEALHRFPKQDLSALEALSIIGGVSDTRADPQGILVLRDYPAAALQGDGPKPPQQRVVFTLDLTSADGLFSAGRFRIQPGDLVYATESPVTTAQTIFGLIGSGYGLARQANTL